MSLINCSECGNEMSNRANNCPRCGCPNPCLSQNNTTQESNTVKKKESILGIIGCLLSFILCNIFCSFIAFILCLLSLRKRDKGQSCAVFGLILSTIGLYLNIFVINSDVGKENNSSTAKEPVAITKTEQTDDGIIDVTVDGCTIKYLRHEIIEDTSGEKCLAVFYEFTNNSNETTSCIYEFSDKAFQKGIELDTSYFFAEGIEDNESKEIKPGVSVEVYTLFKYKDTSNVELEMYEWVSLNNIPLDSMILSFN